MHVCITGIEKVVPTLEDFAALLRLLHALGDRPADLQLRRACSPDRRRAGDRDGPEHMYFILVDAGRTNLVGGDMQEMLRCIRCGACMNHCPVYKTVGGHAYGWVYPGPMGAVLTPSYVGLENALDLPHAATLCNQCGVVCPVKIPLPELLRKLREKQVEQRLRPKSELFALRRGAGSRSVLGCTPWRRAGRHADCDSSAGARAGSGACRAHPAGPASATSSPREARPSAIATGRRDARASLYDTRGHASSCNRA